MVPGLVRIPDFITAAEEEALVLWFGIGRPTPGRKMPGNRSRVARYGPGVVATGYYTGEVDPVIPRPLALLANQLVRQGLVDEFQDAITVNEYAPGEGISYHTDHPTAGAVITTLALWGDATLSLQARRKKGVIERHDVHVPRRMLVQFTGECRHPPWKHAILPVSERRFSIVFRHGGSGPGIVQTDLDRERVE